MNVSLASFVTELMAALPLAVSVNVFPYALRSHEVE